jgi:surface polysaccharide O-acyltransferase-like enzyme
MIWLDNARIAAIFAVVWLHVAAAVVTKSELGSVNWWVGNGYDAMVRWCVPVFVMISGALLLDPARKESLSDFYQKRMARIVWPILFWTVFFLLFSLLKGKIKGEPLSLMDLLAKLSSGRPYYHMWFLFMILFLYLFTPFFRMVVASCSRRELTWLIVAGFALASANSIFGNLFADPSRFFPNWFLFYTPYFFIGYWIRTDPRRGSTPLLAGGVVLCIALTTYLYWAVAQYHSPEMAKYFYDYLSLTVIPMALCMMYLFKKWDKPIISADLTKKLSLLTFGVYLTHPIMLDIATFLGFGPQRIHPLQAVPLLGVLAFAASLGLSWLISQIPGLRRIV